MKHGFLALLALCAATASPTAAQQASQCASRLDVSDMVDHVFDTFVNQNAAALRADRGIDTQSDTAPHGLLHDNAACALLRTATLAGGERKFVFVTELRF